MTITNTNQLTDEQFQQVNRLWDSEFPVQLNGRFEEFLDNIVHPRHYVIEDERGQLMAWAVHFEKDQEKRFSIIVSSSHQGKGLGSALVQLLKADLGEFYGWVIDHASYVKADGTPYLTPIQFYIKHGFERTYDPKMK
jgi:GNAT superfamily N-acetyltransferase